MSDLILIVLSAFAVIGVFSVYNIFSSFVLRNNFPKSITVMLYSESDMAYLKYKSLIYNIYNNEILMIGNPEKNIYDNASTICENDVSKHIINNLFTKNDN